MEKITVYAGEHFPVQPDQAEVFRWLQCGMGLPCRPAYETAWDQAVLLLRQTAAPRAAVLREGADRLAILLTLGNRAEALASSLFQRQEYITGSLLNVLCDELLFQMDRRAALLLQRDLEEEKLFMASREEPGAGLSVPDQQRCLEQMKRAMPDVRISEHGMISPAKSMMYRLVLSRQCCGSALLHDCASCPQKDCLYRSVK
ncbi:MAG: hypothetical protein IK099_10510 [Clostridia bacterium]|nr:hypothetical protein [Clostridia bacterium]